MRERRDTAGLADPLHAFGELRFPAEDVAVRRFVQIIVKGLAQVGDVALLDQDLREVGTPGHAAAARLGFFQRDIEAELLQARHQADVAVAPRGLLAQYPRAEIAEPVA